MLDDDQVRWVWQVACFISGSSGGQCSDGWESFNGGCYYFPHDPLNWTASRNQCMSVGGHLVIIDRKEEQV